MSIIGCTGLCLYLMDCSSVRLHPADNRLHSCTQHLPSALTDCSNADTLRSYIYSQTPLNTQTYDYKINTQTTYIVIYVVQCEVCSAPVWQLVPLYCGGQRHSRTPRLSLQIPPFRHGLKRHRFRSTHDNHTINSILICQDEVSVYSETISAEWLELK